MKLAAIKFTCLTLAIALLAACQKELDNSELPGQAFNLKIDFKAVVDAEPLQFNKEYKNTFQEPYSVSAFKYYIYNISLINTDSNIVYHVSSNDHFLIDASNPSSTEVSVKSMSFKYNYLSFTIGVDSARNTSGAQTGALDPAQGMFWTWSSGYIMAKLEGNSPLSNQPNNKFEYHIGGFKGQDNVIENVVLAFPNSQDVEFLPGSTGIITLNANVNSWFHNPNNIRLATNPVCMTPGELSKKIAKNYSNMFAIAEIISNR